MTDDSFIDPEGLLQMMAELQVGKDLLVIDVRDTDRDEGWIKGSIHLPSNQRDGSQLDGDAMEGFIRNVVVPLAPKLLVFHCAYSQVRGPRASQLFRTVAPRVYGGGSELVMPRALVLRGGWIGFNSYVRTVKGTHLLEGR